MRTRLRDHAAPDTGCVGPRLLGGRRRAIREVRERAVMVSNAPRSRPSARRNAERHFHRIDACDRLCEEARQDLERRRDAGSASSGIGSKRSERRSSTCSASAAALASLQPVAASLREDHHRVGARRERSALFTSSTWRLFALQMPHATGAARRREPLEPSSCAPRRLLLGRDAPVSVRCSDSDQRRRAFARPSARSPRAARRPRRGPAIVRLPRSERAPSASCSAGG
jgi:hypothetical protein